MTTDLDAAIQNLEQIKEALEQLKHEKTIREIYHVNPVVWIQSGTGHIESPVVHPASGQ